MPELRQNFRQERSVGELFGQLTQDLALLVRQEAQLAKTEMQAKVSRATTNLVSLATGGIVALIGALALAAALILLLVDPVGLEPWLAALLVGAVLAGVGYFMLQGGLRDLKQIDPAPRRTVESIKEDIQVAKEARS
jgi:predicted phage tail protein